MTADQITHMFGPELAGSGVFRVHDWRNDVETVGIVDSSYVRAATNNYINKPWPAQLNKLVSSSKHDIIFSIGQVVPHEVMGMANYNKNLFVGVGGVDAINLSHFIGAVYGMENMMGKADNPLRRILNKASEDFLEGKLPLYYILTVMGKDGDGSVAMKGLYFGDSIECYNQACAHSLRENFTMLQTPLKKVVVYLDPSEFHSTWLGNKSIYRTRMAIADGGELIVLAPGVQKFGEDDAVDLLIRKYGYKGTPEIMKNMDANDELKENLSAVAHLIHGSSEGRFSVRYCTDPAKLTKEEVEGVGYGWSDLKEVEKVYDVSTLTDGVNVVDGEEIFYISNPALGLWSVQSKFESSVLSPGGGGGGEEKEVDLGEGGKQVGVGGSGGVGGSQA
jgi:nickel-dependent lactate racemase